MAEGHADQPQEIDVLEITEKLLDRLKGRVNLLQPLTERNQLVIDVLNDLCREYQTNGWPDLANELKRRNFLQTFLSYDPIEECLQDPAVEDIMINSFDMIFVHKTGQGMVKIDKRFAGIRELNVFVKKLIVFGGRTELEAINDLELAGIRGRVNIVLSPFGPQITITRAKKHPLSVMELIERGTLTYELAAQLWMYVDGLSVKPANLIIAGGPGTGKTTLLNALLSFIPAGERLVVIEDTLELNTNFLENCSRLESYGGVTMAALVKNSLRMRLDRIVVGEVRGEEARDFMTAVNIGKYCLGTVHASTARETVMRLQNEPMNVPETLVNLVDVFVILRRFARQGKVTRVIGEVVETAGLERGVVLLSPVWQYDYEQLKIRETSPSSVYRDRLAQAAGVRPDQIQEETARRAIVLRLMHEKLGVTDVGETMKFCQFYVTDPEQAMQQLGIQKQESKKHRLF